MVPNWYALCRVNVNWCIDFVSSVCIACVVVVVLCDTMLKRGIDHSSAAWMDEWMDGWDSESGELTTMRWIMMKMLFSRNRVTVRGQWGAYGRGASALGTRNPKSYFWSISCRPNDSWASLDQLLVTWRQMKFVSHLFWRQRLRDDLLTLTLTQNFSLKG